MNNVCWLFLSTSIYSGSYSIFDCIVVGFDLALSAMSRCVKHSVEWYVVPQVDLLKLGSFWMVCVSFVMLGSFWMLCVSFVMLGSFWMLCVSFVMLGSFWMLYVSFVMLGSCWMLCVTFVMLVSIVCFNGVSQHGSYTFFFLNL